MRPSWSFVDGVLNLKKKTKIADEIACFMLQLSKFCDNLFAPRNPIKRVGYDH